MQSKWQSFLQQQSANISEGLLLDFGDPIAEHAHALNEDSITDLSRLDVLKISGKDASDFLHGQLSSDVSALAVNKVQMSSWCNIKGRVIVSFLLYRSHDCFYILLEREMMELVSKRLGMFVMRSDVSIHNQSDELMRIGIRGESLHKHLQQTLDASSTPETFMLLAMQDSLPRSILLIPLEHAPALWQQLSAEAHRIGEKAWSMFDIKAGIAWVGKSGTEEFLPQSLNLDLTGGLSFTKGCYPGQEIIARMHFRGKLKQRLFLANVAINEPPQITTKLYSTDVTKHIGVVANATMQNENNCLMLVVLELEYATSGPIHLGEENGPVLNLEALPYSPDSV